MSRYNELYDGVVDLEIKYLMPAYEHNNPLINEYHAVHSRRSPWTINYQPNNPPGIVVGSERKDDLLIRDFWFWGTYCILVMRDVNTEAVSYMNKTPEKSIVTAKQE